MTFKKAFVLQKLDEIANYIAETKQLLAFSDGEISKDIFKSHSAERLLQLIVDSMIDINQHFIKELNLKVSEDFQGTFYILGENKILSMAFARKIAPVVGLRNRIVHRYEELNQKLFLKTLRKNFPDFTKYLLLVRQYVKTKR